MTRSDALEQLDVAQREVNKFFWSSELAYQLVRQKVLSEEVHSRLPNRVDVVFGDVKCHAFIPPNKPGRSTKYDASTREFETHLRNDLEQICRHVIVRFYGALEQYIGKRSSPFLNYAGLNRDQRREKKKAFPKTPFQEMDEYLRADRVRLRKPVPHDKALLAQACRRLRNHVVHREREWTSPWEDDEFRNAIGTAFKGDDLSLIMSGLCDKAKRRAKREGDVPVLFFYAMYSLTDFRNFANSIDAALPL